MKVARPKHGNASRSWLSYSYVWVWSAVFLSALVCVAIAWVHLEQRRELKSTFLLLENLREARINLSRGFLHLNLGTAPGSPFDHVEGLALLRQAVESFRDTGAGLDTSQLEGTDAFRRSVAALQTQLSDSREQSPTPDQAAALRIAFTDLESQATALDAEIESALQRHSKWMDVVFAIALIGAAVLLIGICAVVYYSERVKERLEASSTKTEKALREHESLLADLMEHSGALVFVKDRAGRHQLVNRRWQEMTGLKPEEVLGKTDTELFPAALAQSFRQNDLNAMDSASPVQREEVFGHGDKQRIFLSLKFPVRDAVGAVRGVCGIATDITDRKRMETELRQTAEHKTALVKEIHHRVKNNLAIMVSLINLQARQIRHPEAIGALADTKGRLQAMSLVHEILYRSGRLDRVVMGEYLEKLCLYLAQSLGAAARNIELHTRFADLNMEINQAVPCGLILCELVSNALKHGFPNGGPGKVSVELESVSPDQVALRVSDNGVGLPAGLNVEQLNTLGLRLVQTLTKQVQGTLSVKNQNGAVFEVRFGTPSSLPENAML